MQESQFGAAEVSQQKRVIHFTSGDTLDLDSEEEEEKPTLFRDNERKGRFRNLAMRVGRLSLLACDFLGERMAGFLGLRDAKYQYAIDQHQRKSKTVDRDTTDAGTTPLSPQVNASRYGATEDPGQEQMNGEAPRPDRGQLNGAYQAEDGNRG
ncbi:protein FAM177A1 [Eucyclogobius newberryi]|uniref:protein FAM177A1 n=1 Tax=Eucyclogobius newberryi TaxID=166745 RepID=UPI003B5C3DBA